MRDKFVEVLLAAIISAALMAWVIGLYMAKRLNDGAPLVG